jgi:hypothetical protein
MADDDRTFHAAGDRVPVPDPTKLTQEATQRLEAAMRALIALEVQHTRDLFDEKLHGVELRFVALEARTAEQKQDTANALAAALTAQKDAVAAQTVSSERAIEKSETATIERIKSVETLLATSTKATDDKISDLKDRVVAIEAGKIGGIEERGEHRATAQIDQQNVAFLVACIALILGPIVAIVIHFLK